MRHLESLEQPGRKLKAALGWGGQEFPGLQYYPHWMSPGWRDSSAGQPTGILSPRPRISKQALPGGWNATHTDIPTGNTDLPTCTKYISIGNTDIPPPTGRTDKPTGSKDILLVTRIGFVV